MHAVLPGNSANFPAAHAWQVEAPGTAEDVPAGHGVHDAAPESENVPAGHVVQAVVTPVP